MNFRSTGARLAAATVGAAVAGTLAFGASPASAAASGAFVSGGGYTYDDWDDEGTLSSSSYAKSNSTCLWQKILWAEGYGTLSEVDGVFGPKTTSRTKSLQTRWGLSADGKVGNKTFTKAGDRLTESKYVNESPMKMYRLKYKGKNNIFYVYRSSDGKYSFYADGAYRYAGYNYRSCS